MNAHAWKSEVFATSGEERYAECLSEQPRPRSRFTVLFVCIGNSCRSPMAEAIARRDAPDIIQPVSAGIAPLGFVAEATKVTLQANGIPADHLSSKELSEELWTSADLVINMTGRAGKLAFRWLPERGDVEDWQIQDPYGEDSAVYQRTCEDLRRRIRALAERLRKMAPQASEKA